MVGRLGRDGHWRTACRRRPAQAGLACAIRAGRLVQLVDAQTAIVGAELDLDGVMRIAAERALIPTGAQGSAVELLEGDEIVAKGVAGVCAGFLGLRLKADTTITGKCFRTRQVLVCEDSESDPRVERDACRLVGARSLIVVPLLHNEDMHGVLLVYSAAPHAFRDDEAEFLSLLANMVAATLVRAELMARLTGEAITDELTGLPNRRSWYLQLGQALSRAARTDLPLTVLVLALNDFKRVNDYEGHAAGDRLLKSVSSLCADQLRTTDLLGRIGGDAFAIILEQTDEEATLQVITRFDRSLKGHSTASTGLAVWDREEDAAALIARADASMYGHKRPQVTAR